MENPVVMSAPTNSLSDADSSKSVPLNFNFMVLNSQYNKILKYLETTLGKEAISSVDMEAISVTDKISQLDLEISDLEKQIQNLKKGDENNTNLKEFVELEKKIRKTSR